MQGRHFNRSEAGHTLSLLCRGEMFLISFTLCHKAFHGLAYCVTARLKLFRPYPVTACLSPLASDLLPCHLLCHHSLCHVQSCHLMPCHRLPCHLLYHLWPCQLLSCHLLLCHSVSSHLLKSHFFGVIHYQALSRFVISCHILCYALIINLKKSY